jgi:hypothetical protein
VVHPRERAPIAAQLNAERVLLDQVVVNPVARVRLVRLTAGSKMVLPRPGSVGYFDLDDEAASSMPFAWSRKSEPISSFGGSR